MLRLIVHKITKTPKNQIAPKSNWLPNQIAPPKKNQIPPPKNQIASPLKKSNCPLIIKFPTSVAYAPRWEPLV